MRILKSFVQLMLSLTEVSPMKIRSLSDANFWACSMLTYLLCVSMGVYNPILMIEVFTGIPSN